MIPIHRSPGRALLLILLFATPRVASADPGPVKPPPLESVPHVDLARYAGTVHAMGVILRNPVACTRSSAPNGHVRIAVVPDRVPAGPRDDARIRSKPESWSDAPGRLIRS